MGIMESFIIHWLVIGLVLGFLIGLLVACIYFREAVMEYKSVVEIQAESPKAVLEWLSQEDHLNRIG